MDISGNGACLELRGALMESTVISGDGTFWIRQRVSGEDMGHPQSGGWSASEMEFLEVTAQLGQPWIP